MNVLWVMNEGSGMCSVDLIYKNVEFLINLMCE